jgi:hypothetical protein
VGGSCVAYGVPSAEKAGKGLLRLTGGEDGVVGWGGWCGLYWGVNDHSGMCWAPNEHLGIPCFEILAVLLWVVCFGLWLETRVIGEMSLDIDWRPSSFHVAALMVREGWWERGFHGCVVLCKF